MSGTSSELDLLLLGDAHAHEKARLQDTVLVVQHGAGSKCAGAGVDLGRDVVERAGVRIALLGLQADIDGDRTQVLERDAPCAFLADRQHLLLVDVELHVDRMICTMVASLVGPPAPTMAPGSTRRADTRPSNGAMMVV